MSQQIILETFSRQKRPQNFFSLCDFTAKFSSVNFPTFISVEWFFALNFPSTKFMRLKLSGLVIRQSHWNFSLLQSSYQHFSTHAQTSKIYSSKCHFLDISGNALAPGWRWFPAYLSRSLPPQTHSSQMIDLSFCDSFRWTFGL